MKRVVKNILVIVCIFLLAFSSYFIINTSYQQTGIQPPNESSNTEQLEDDHQLELPESGEEPPQLLSDDKTMESGMNSNSMISNVLLVGDALLISLMIVYMIMSKFNKKTFKKTMKNKDKIIIYVLTVVLLTSVISVGEIYMSHHYFINEPMSDNKLDDQSEVEASRVKEIDNRTETLNDSYDSSHSDESAVLVKNGGQAIIKDAKINKQKGDSSNTENS